MTVNHEDVVKQVAAQKAPDNTSTDTLLPFVLRVLAALPPSEKAGLLRKDGGENIARYEPAGVNVSISRICYPDGSIYKILSDAGPGGTNGPSWADNGTVDKAMYVAVDGTHVVTGGGGGTSGAQPYPGDDWSSGLMQAINATYDEAHAPHDDGRYIWQSRTLYDIGAGLEKEASKKKHLAELRQALGLH